MGLPGRLYGSSLALLTDLYQLTMAYGYWKSGLRDREAVFHLFFRNQPFDAGYAIAGGLPQVIEFVRDFHFERSDLEYLATLTGRDERPLFERAFLNFLGELRLACDLDAVPEGSVVFAQEPLIRVQGPIIAGQLLETPLLTRTNFPTLVATKAARVCAAAEGEPVLEFGLRRAQGPDGGLTAARAAYLGGCAATSNVLAGKRYGIPVKGTHAHSWVMCFDNELESFRAYAAAMPNNCIFLVDTYDTLDGVRNAVRVGKEMRACGHEMAGIRLDSGDLAYLSIEARKILDEAGFPDAQILGSGDLDEILIQSLKRQGATIGVWGVGTKLATAYDQPALGGVYKLAATRDPGCAWQYKLKLSEQRAKITNPGLLQVRRYEDADRFVGDAIYNLEDPIDGGCKIIDPMDETRRKVLGNELTHSDLLVPVFRGGELVYDVPDLEAARGRVRAQIEKLHVSIRRFENPHEYPVGLEEKLHALKMRLILQARGEATPEE